MCFFKQYNSAALFDIFAAAQALLPTLQVELQFLSGMYTGYTAFEYQQSANTGPSVNLDVALYYNVAT